jgi:hypothetical protein
VTPIQYKSTEADDRKRMMLSASITVEAAFVLPIVILLILALFYLAFYLHDVCRIQGIVDGTLHKAGLMIKQDGKLESTQIDYEHYIDQGVFSELMDDHTELERELKDYLNRSFTEGLLLSRIEEVQTEVGRMKLSVTIRVSTTITIPWIKELMAMHSYTVISTDYPVHDPAETIRACEVILETAEQIKGVKYLKNKLEAFLQGVK